MWSKRDTAIKIWHLYVCMAKCYRRKDLQCEAICFIVLNLIRLWKTVSVLAECNPSPCREHLGWNRDTYNLGWVFLIAFPPILGGEIPHSLHTIWGEIRGWYGRTGKRLYCTDTVIGLDHCVSPRKKREEQEQLLRHLHLPSHTQLLGSSRSCQQQLTYFSQTFWATC